jgi:hypothetical protein
MVPIKLNGVRMFAVVVGNDTGVLVRVSADEFEQLGAAPGRSVRIEALAVSGTFLVVAADDDPPFVFLRLLPQPAQLAG